MKAVKTKFVILVSMLAIITSCALLDKTPPAFDFSIMKITDVAGESFILNVSASDESGIDRVEIYANDKLIYKTNQLGQISFPAPYGSFTLKIVVYDRAGNSTSRVVSEFRTRDLTPPTVSISYTPTNPLPGETVNILVTAQDEESGVRTKGLRINGEEVQLNADRFTLQVRAGVYELEAYALDFEGNFSTNKVILNVSVAFDTTGPQITFPELPKKVKPGTVVNINILASDESGVSKIVFNDGRELFLVPTNPSTSLFWNLARNVGTINPYSFTVTAYDTRNNYTVKSGSIEIGMNLPPSVSIEVDKPAPREGEKVRIIVNASDDSMVKQVVLYVNNIAVRTFNQPPYIHEWTAVRGSHKIRVVAIDDSNESSEAHYTINVGVIDTEPPVIYFSPPYGVPVGQAHTFYVFVTDNVQVDRVEFTFTDPIRKGPIRASPIGGGVFTLTETFNVKGNYEVIVTAFDTSNNSSSQKGQFPVDEAYIVKAPRIKEFSYSPSTLNQGERVRFKVVAEDDLGLSRCDMFVNNIKRGSSEPTVNTFEWEWIATTLGHHEIRVVVVDTEGFTAQATGSVVVTSSRPIASILQPEDGFRTPFAENMSLSIAAQVIDTNKPAEAYFDIKGPVNRRIDVRAVGEGPVYNFNANWRVEAPGEYWIDFYYRNDIHLSASTSVTLNILNLGVVFEQPLPGQLHQCGYPLVVRVKTSAHLTEDGKFYVTHSNRSLQIDTPTPIATSSAHNIYQAQIDKSFLNEPGAYTVTFSAKTSKGEEGRATTFITVIDSEPPTIVEAKINVSDIVEGGIYNVLMSDSPSLNVIVTDNRQVASIRLQKRVSGIYTDTQVSTTTTLTHRIVNLEPFENHFRIVVRDLDNNETVRNFVIYAYERNSPIGEGVRSFQLYPQAVVYDMNIPVIVQVRGSLNNNTQFKVSDDTGIKEVRIRVVDSQTNGSNYSETVKKLYDYISGNLVKEIFINNQDVPMFTPSRVDQYSVNLEAVDVFGNVRIISQQNFRVEDLTPPIVNIDIPTGKFYGTDSEGRKILREITDIKVSFLDNTEPIHRIELWLIDSSNRQVKVGEKSDLATNSWTFENVSLTTYSDGIAKLRAFATAMSGATGMGELSVVIDNKRAPIVTIQLPPALSFAGKRVYRGIIDIRADISGTDVPQDVQRVELYVDGVRRTVMTAPVQNGGESFVFTLNTADYQDGEHRLALRVYDRANNSSELTDLRCLADVIFDNSPPSLLGDQSRVYTNQATVTFWIVEDYGVVETFLRIGDRRIDPLGGTFVFEHGLSQNTFSNFLLHVKDTAGNVANHSGILFYDTTPPTITIQNVQPTPIATESGVRFTLIFSDNLAGVSALNVLMNGQSIQTLPLNSGETSRVWHYSPSANLETTATFRFEIFDRAGNKDTVERQINIDTRAPNIVRFDCETLAPIDGVHYTNSDSVVIAWTISDGNFSHAKLEKDGVTVVTSGVTSGSHIVGLNVGSNLVKLTAYDLGGNVSEKTLTIIRDVQKPQISNIRIDGVNVQQNGATVILNDAGNKLLTFSVDENYIDWSSSELRISGTKISSGNDWSKTGASPTYSVSTSVNVINNTQISIILRDYAANEEVFTFTVNIQSP